VREIAYVRIIKGKGEGKMYDFCIIVFIDGNEKHRNHKFITKQQYDTLMKKDDEAVILYDSLIKVCDLSGVDKLKIQISDNNKIINTLYDHRNGFENIVWEPTK